MIKLIPLLEVNIVDPNLNLPEGWKEDDVEEGENFEMEEVVKRYSAPMEGWDENHEDVIFIERENNEYYISVYLAFSDVVDEGSYPTLNKAIRKAIQIMKEIKEEWDNERYV